GLKWLCILAAAAAVIVLGINFIVVGMGGRDLVSEKDMLNESSFKADCIIVLGAQVKADGTPSKMLRDRLDEGIRLYEAGAAPKILMSGDDGQVEYNEVAAMAAYAEDAGVSKKDLFLDHAGFSTYESMYRAQYIFGVKRAIVVTQKYHEYRALYIGQRLGMDVRGVSAADINYAFQGFRDIREVMARDKDFLQCIFWPKPTYLGDKIDIKGDGRQTR
ncbi:MAG: ElyC/SanA/YdcF family protein, partial [Anaerovoracaceae bacterium]|nr:ElyC/SanA/YdcF family protein [Anaerovoracaceae bacterium]